MSLAHSIDVKAYREFLVFFHLSAASCTAEKKCKKIKWNKMKAKKVKIKYNIFSCI